MITLDASAVARLQQLLRDVASVEDRLAEAALLLAQAHDPDVDVAAYLRQFEDWAGYMLGCLPDEASNASERIECLNRFLFDEMGFTGNSEHYSDPRNSFLNSVIDRRMGIPITLSVLYIELGRRIGLPLQGVAFPGHFLVMLPVSHGAVVLDPYSEGMSLELSDLEKLLLSVQPDRRWDREQIRHMLTPANLRDILVRMLRNLKAVYWDAKDVANAIWVQDLLLAVDGDLDEERRDRGILKEQAGYYKSAVKDFSDYLERVPDAVDADLIRTRMVDLSRHVRHLH